MKFVFFIFLFLSRLTWGQFNEEGIASYKLKTSSKNCVAMSIEFFVDPKTQAPFVQIGEACVWRDKYTTIRDIPNLKVNGDQVEFHGVNCGKINKIHNPWMVDHLFFHECFWLKGTNGLNDVFQKKNVTLNAYKYPGNGTLIFEGKNSFDLKNHIILDENGHPAIVFTSDVKEEVEVSRFSSPELIYKEGNIVFKGKVCGKLNNSGGINRSKHEYYLNCKIKENYHKDPTTGEKTIQILLIPHGLYPRDYLF